MYATEVSVVCGGCQLIVCCVCVRACVRAGYMILELHEKR